MNWRLVHIAAEEFELWSTVAINAGILVGALSGAASWLIARLRRFSRERVRRVALNAGIIGGVATATFVIGFTPYFIAERTVAASNDRVAKFSECLANAHGSNDEDDCIIEFR